MTENTGGLCCDTVLSVPVIENLSENVMSETEELSVVEKQSAEQLILDHGIDDTSCSSQSSLIAMAAMASTLRSERLESPN